MPLPRQCHTCHANDTHLPRQCHTPGCHNPPRPCHNPATTLPRPCHTPATFGVHSGVHTYGECNRVSLVQFCMVEQPPRYIFYMHMNVICICNIFSRYIYNLICEHTHTHTHTSYHIIPILFGRHPLHHPVTSSALRSFNRCWMGLRCDANAALKKTSQQPAQPGQVGTTWTETLV